MSCKLCTCIKKIKAVVDLDKPPKEEQSKEAGKSFGPWPPDEDEALLDFYGEPGTNFVMMRFPYPMRLAWNHGVTVHRAQCNVKCKDAFESVFESIFDHYDRDVILVKEHRMDLFGGIINVRKRSGSDRWSLHAFGAAIDLDPEQNGLGWQWPQVATMPRQVIRIFQDHGAAWGGKWRRPDPMHFEFTR